ncbi:MAG: NAD kinase [Bacteroidales bacterium]|nr:NAD kinase [Bacteroidales bacterium]
MNIALYGKTFNEEFRPYIRELFRKLTENNTRLSVYKSFYDYIRAETGLTPAVSSIYSNYNDFDPASELMISIGGDGTFLESIPYVIRYDIPVIGINSGRLGFLAYISKEGIIKAFDAIFSNNFDIEYRTMIHFLNPVNGFDGLNYALNEITIQKSGSSMITIDAFVNEEFLNTYWTDGLIISTPTGSTAYSLSAAGPIVVPGSGSFIIAPIASHNMTVRPLIIPDDTIITLKVKSRTGKFLVTADNRTVESESGQKFTLGKADYQLKMLRLPHTSFYSTIRNKLMWGVDKRN